MGLRSGLKFRLHWKKTSIREVLGANKVFEQFFNFKNTCKSLANYLAAEARDEQSMIEETISHSANGRSRRLK